MEIDNWIDFINHSPTAFHASKEVAKKLDDKGFVQLEEEESWSINKNQGYYLLKDGSIIAFYIPNKVDDDMPFRLWGAHTDSPSLKIKPIPEIRKKNYLMISSEVYGGAILNTWLDRPLGIAGKIYLKNNSTKNQKTCQKIEEKLIYISKPLMIIPNLAIHLNREINKQFSINRENHLQALFSHSITDQSYSFKSFLSSQIERDIEDILSYDLFLVDIEPAKLFGKEKEFINSPRLDNLAMVDAGLKGFLKAIDKQEILSVIPMVAFFNHEEIGSRTYTGAMSSFLSHTLKRMGRHLFKSSADHYLKNLAKSFMVSADMAHGFHPAYESMYEGNHQPILNQGLVIKYNANHHYSSNAFTSAFVKEILLRHKIPYQEYIQHGEIPCGSTIGPIVSSQLSIPTVDLGNPMLAMHSIRETAGVKDHLHAIQFAEKFLGDQ